MSKIQRVQREKGKQASRFLKPASEKLGRLIELVNMLPPELSLPEIEDILKFEAAELPDGAVIEGTDWVSKIERGLSRCLEGLPQVFRDYVWDYPDSMFNDDRVGALENAIATYMTFREARMKLFGLARINKLDPQRIKSFTKFHRSLDGAQHFYIDEQGRAQFVQDPFADAIQGEEVARIRECEICQRVFWAGRADMRCCSSKCAKVLRTRRWRDKYQTHYKQQRIDSSEKKQAARGRQKQGTEKTKAR